MKRGFIVAVILLLPITALTLIGRAEGPEASAPSTGVPLPKSLDQFYPPASPGPEYLMEMHKLARPMSGLMSDFFEGDTANAVANFQAFEEQYRKVLGLVPEWTELFPQAPVEALGRAVHAGDQAGVGAAMEAIGQSCHSCHAATMIAAHQRYHWGDFNAIEVTDPATGRAASFRELMHLIEADMTGAANDFMQGQPEGARAHATNLKSRFATLKETCAACHDSERAYFVDDHVGRMVADLGAAMDGGGSPEQLTGILQGIGQESCFKCHLVHLPAAYSAHRQ